MSTTLLGRPFSREFLDAEVALPIEGHLLPWAKADVRETLEEDVPKAEKRLRLAEKELVSARAKLAKQEPDSPDQREVQKVVDFLEGQCANSRSRLEFYDGKVYLLRRRIAVSSKAST